MDETPALALAAGTLLAVVALLALVLWPVVWLLSLPFRLVGVAPEGVFRVAARAHPAFPLGCLAVDPKLRRPVSFLPRLQLLQLPPMAATLVSCFSAASRSFRIRLNVI